MKARRAGVAWIALGLAACSGGNVDDVNGDAAAGTSVALSTDVRRALHADGPAATQMGAFVPPTAVAPMADGSGRYLMRRSGVATFFTQSGLSFALSSADTGWGVHCSLVGGASGTLAAEDEQPARVRQYVGTSSARELPTFARVAWPSIRPGIDMVAEPPRFGVAYRFVLSPGAKVSDIVLRWDGATAVRAIDSGRGYDVETGIGVLRVRGLRAYAIGDPSGVQRTELAAHHVVRDNQVSIEVDGWNGRVPLVIDPTVAWASFLGGASPELSGGIAVDSAGNAYLTGTTSSADFPSTGGFDTTVAGDDAFLTKISAAGTLVWSTYLGGVGQDKANAVAIDPSGNVFLTGATGSTDFPSSGGFDTSHNGGPYDAFVTKVSAAGALLWSSFLGGNAIDQGYSVAVDSSGNVFVTGGAESSDFPASGAFDTTPNGTTDVFVTKVSGAGALLWSSFLGGSNVDYGTSIAVDSSGNALVTGSTASTNFPIVSGFDTAMAGTTDAFVAKVSAAGALSWSSFLGGTNYDYAKGIAVDASGNAFVTGATGSIDFPRSGGFDTSYSALGDAFVTKVSGAGAILWSSYLGGSGGDVGMAIAVDPDGNALVTGYTQSSNFPTAGGFDTTIGDVDAFVTKVSGSGSLLWSSFLGGGYAEEGDGIAVSSAGNTFIAGKTSSIDFPTTSAFDTTIGGSNDVFVVKLDALPLGTPCTVSSECRSSFCVDLVCCDKACNGKCEACRSSKGSSADGTCGFINGTDPDKDCPAQTCTAGVITKAQVCDGAGGCRSDGTTPCGLYPCAGSACATTCAVDAECAAAGFCSGTTCAADLDLGGACTRASQCKSGFCADGVCCDRACTGACEACTVAKKGSGTDGSCGNVPAGTDPKEACTAGTGTCAPDGTCDGAGSCRAYAKAGTPCGPTACVGGVVTGKVCKGDDASCIDSPGTACGAYACGATACKTSCTTDSDCDGAYYCNSLNVCVSKLARGIACTAGRECASGFCADSVCCERACSGQCESCNEPGGAGSCSPVTGKPRGTRMACDALADNDCAKTACDGTIRDKCAGYANGTTTACGADGCTPDKKFQKAGTCDGRGKCAAPEPQNCTPYVCDPAATGGCKSSCANDGDCAEGFACSEGKCLQGAKCTADKTGSIDKSGTETSCVPYRCGTDGKCLQACASSVECAAGNVCDVATKVCAPAVPPSTEESGGCGCETGPRPGASSLLAMSLALSMALLRRSARRGR